MDDERTEGGFTTGDRVRAVGRNMSNPLGEGYIKRWPLMMGQGYCRVMFDDRNARGTVAGFAWVELADLELIPDSASEADVEVMANRSPSGQEVEINRLGVLCLDRGKELTRKTAEIRALKAESSHVSGHVRRLQDEIVELNRERIMDGRRGES